LNWPRCHGQGTLGNIVGYRVEVYYHPRGVKKWTYLGQVKTGGGGSVDFTEYRILNGYLKIVFPRRGSTWRRRVVRTT